MENLRITEKYKRTGLYVYCQKCHSYSTIKDGFLKKKADCNHPPERQVFKIKIHVPGTRNMCKTKVLDTRDLAEADLLRVQFMESLKQNNYSTSPMPSIGISVAEKYLLTYQMDSFLDYKTNGGLQIYERSKKVSKDAIKYYERVFRYFFNSIKKTTKVNYLRVDEIDENHLTLFHKYLMNRKFSNKYYNNIMVCMKTFFNHMKNYEKLEFNNLFKRVGLRPVHYDNQSFTLKEFKQVLAVTNLANGYDAKRKRNRYREWLPTAFRLGVFTCLRLDELVHIKYSDIINEDSITFLQASDRKVNKLISEKNNERVKRVPVIPELRRVLIEECGLEKNQDKDEYILAPELNRNTVKQIITHGFTHFKRVAGIDDRKCFKELRKTYTSHHRAEYGDNGLTSMISGHSNESVVDKHYTAQMDAVRKSKDFRVFPEDNVNDIET